MKFKLLLLLVNIGAMYLVYQHESPDRILLGLSILFCTTFIYLSGICFIDHRRNQRENNFMEALIGFFFGIFFK